MSEIGLIIPYLFLLIFALPFLDHQTWNSDPSRSKAKLGLNEGTILLLSHLIKGFMIVFLFDRVSDDNLLFVVAVSIIGFLVVILYEKQIHAVILRHLSNPYHTSFTLFKERSDRSAFRIVVSIIILIASSSFLAEIVWMTQTISRLFDVSVSLVYISILFLVYVYIIAGGFSAIKKISRLLIVFIFITAACLLLYVYLSRGIRTVYNDWSSDQANIRLISPATLKEQLLWLLVLTFTYLGYLLTNLSLWHISFSMKENRMSAIYKSAAFCFTSLMLTLIMIAVYIKSAVAGQNTSLDLSLQQLAVSYPFFTYLFILSLLSIGLTSAMVSLKCIFEAVLLFDRNDEEPNRRIFKKINLISIGLIFLVFIFIKPTDFLLYTSIKLFLLLCLTAVPSFLFMTLSREKTTMIYMFPAVIGFLSGIVFFFCSAPLLIVLYWGFGISILVMAIVKLCKIILHKE